MIMFGGPEFEVFPSSRFPAGLHSCGFVCLRLLVNSEHLNRPRPPLPVLAEACGSV